MTPHHIGTIAQDIEIIEPRLRLSVREAQSALDAVRGKPLIEALAKLRTGPGRLCEPIARMLDKAVVRAESTAVPLQAWIVAEGSGQPEEDIIRVRRPGYGPGDWIHSPACRVHVVLRPAGESPPMVATPTGHESATHHSNPPTADSNHDQATAIREALSEVIDPDLGVNVVDLGFVRAISVDGRTAVITMTLTSAACPLSVVIEKQVRARLCTVSSIADVRIEWQWLPAWTPSEISPDGREQLSGIGFTI